jgi:DNA-binding Lrp family transcriptional regulator
MGILISTGADTETGFGSMAMGFVLISAAPGKEREVYVEIQKIREVVELHPLFGEYDLIVKLDAPDFNRLGEIVVDKIRKCTRQQGRKATRIVPCALVALSPCGLV